MLSRSALGPQDHGPHVKTAMRPAQRLALATLAAFVATTAASSMCDSDSDFMPDLVELNVGMTCQAMSDDLLSQIVTQMPGESWDDVTCDSLHTIDTTWGVSAATSLAYIADLCCGSLAKTRCFDDTNMCKVSSDFMGSVNLGDHNLGSPGTTCLSMNMHYLASAFNKFTWNDISCEDVTPEGSTIKDELLFFGSACCGSRTKTRCSIDLDSTNMCTVESDFSHSINLEDRGLVTDHFGGGILHTCGDANDYFKTSILMTGSWDNHTCFDMYRIPWFGPESGETRMFGMDWWAIGAACCGSLAKIRCQGALYSASAPLDTEYYTEFLITLPYTEEAFDTDMQMRFLLGLAGATNFGSNHGFTKIMGIVPGPPKEYGQDHTPDTIQITARIATTRSRLDALVDAHAILGEGFASAANRIAAILAGNGISGQPVFPFKIQRWCTHHPEGEVETRLRCGLSALFSPDPLPNSNPQGDHEICAWASAFIPWAEWEWGCAKFTPDNDEDAPPDGWCPEDCGVDHYVPNFACSCNAVVTTSDECLAKMPGESPWARAV